MWGRSGKGMYARHYWDSVGLEALVNFRSVKRSVVSSPGLALGLGSVEFRLRSLLLSSVAMSGLWVGVAPRQAYAQSANCTISGDTATCAPQNGAYIRYPSEGETPTNLIVQNGFVARAGFDAVTLSSSSDIAITVNGDGQTIQASSKYNFEVFNDVVAVSGYSEVGSVTIDSQVGISVAGGAKYGASNAGIVGTGYTGVTINSAGPISVEAGDGDEPGEDGGDALGIGGVSETGVVTISSSGDITVAGGDGFEGEAGGQAVAIAGQSYGAADVTIANSGAITATGGDGYGSRYSDRSSAAGITGSSTGTGSISIHNSGDIEARAGTLETYDEERPLLGSAAGIAGASYSGSVTIDNSGDIAVEADRFLGRTFSGKSPFFSGGISGVVRSGSGSSTVTNSGALTIEGVGNGITAMNKYGDGAVSVANSGDIAISASEARFGGAGLMAMSGQGAMEISNSGNIVVDASGAGTDAELGTIFGQNGILALSEEGQVVVNSSGDVSVIARGEASSRSGKYEGVSGTAASSRTGDVTVVNSGALTVELLPLAEGEYASRVRGITASSRTDYGSYVSGGDVSVTTSGDVTVAGALNEDVAEGIINPETVSAGIVAFSEGGYAYDAGTASITVNGATVRTTGDGVQGIVASGGQGVVTLTNGATVQSSGDGANGIVVGPQLATGDSYGEVLVSSSNSVIIGQGSSVVSESGIAILDAETFTFSGKRSFLRAVSPIENDPETNLDTGSVFNNTTVSISGTVQGGGGTAISLNGGDDTLILGPGYDITGQVDAGEGDEDKGDLFALGGSGTGSFDFSLVDADGSADADDQYIGFERFVKDGTSTFYATGENNEILSLPVLNGALYVNGSLSNAALPVSGGATLGGNGTVGSLVALSGSTIAPGTPGGFGTLSTTGDATFEAGSTFEVAVNEQGTSDRLNVGGSTNIEGGTIHVVATPGDYFEEKTYTILSSNGEISGEFAELTDNLPDIDFRDLYDDREVRLTFTGAVDNFSNKDNAIASVFGAATTATFFVETLGERAGLINIPGVVTNEPLEPLAYAAPMTNRSQAATAIDQSASQATTDTRNQGVWVGAFGGFAEVDSSGGAGGYASRAGGIAGGYEHRFAGEASTALIGLAGGFSQSAVDVTDGGATIDTGHLGVYGSYAHGPLSLSGALAYSRSGYDLSRTISFGGGSVTANGEAAGSAISVFAEASYDLAAAVGNTGFSFSPAVRLRGASANRDAYTETGAGVLNLQVGEDDVSQYFAAIGFQASTTVTMNGIVLKPEFELFYERNLSEGGASSDAVLAATGTTFTTAVAGAGEDRVSLGLGLGAAINESVDAHFRYDGSFGEGTQSNRASVGLSAKF